MENKPVIISDPKDIVMLSILGHLAKTSNGDHNNSPINNQEIEEVNLDARLRAVETDVREIKSNYLTKDSFYKAGGSAVIALIVSAGIALWTVYSHTDTKSETRFSNIDNKFAQIDNRFEQVGSNIHALDIRLTKVETKIDNIETKVEQLDSKMDKALEILSQSK